DRSSINPARFYTLEINLSDGRLDSGDVSFTQVTTLLDGEGNPFPANSLDTEGIVLTENGSVYISSEGEVRPDIPRLANPFVNEFSLSGQQLSQLPIDDKFFAVDGTTKGIRNNLAFESLTLTPDGRYLYTATENALASDGTAATLTDTSLSRIVKYDLTTGQVVAEFVYEVEPIPKASNPVGGFADNGLVELLAIDNNGTLLSLERSFAAGVGNTVKLYQIQTQGALDVSSFDDLFSETQNTRFAIDSPVKKKLLVDFQADLGITPDNLEGLSLGPILPDGRQSLIVVSDNNFNPTQTTQFIALGLDIQTTPAVLPVIETADAIDDANGETTTLGLLGDSDDPAVWIDPDNAEDSLMIGTLKDGGLAVFSLNGEVLQKITPTDILGATADFGDLRYNNVDVLYNFQLGTETVDIALVSDRANDTINIFKIDPTTHKLVNLTSSQLLAPAFSVFGVDDGDATVYGLAGYRSPVSSKSYVFVTQAGGNKIAQLELKADAQGLITAEVVQTINLPIATGKTASDYQSEAIAVDQEKGIVYLAVENEIGIVKFAAEPNGGNTITVVRPVDSSELTPDLEGLAIYYGPNGTGYLVASSQGDSSYAVYSREGSNSYLGSFVVGDNLPAGIDQANETDGLEIINVPLGPTFPFGALLVQDGANNPQNTVENGDELENNNTNFKFVRWDDVANAFDTPLIVDTTSYNPRDSSVNPTPEPPIALTPIGTYATGQYNQSAAEIPAYDPASKRLFVVNAQKGKVDVLDASNPTNPTLITSIDTSAFGLPNSVAIKDGLVAIAVENIDKQAKGQVLFYSANSQDFATPLKALEVGALPDMLAFSPDGKKVLVANEGEPNGDYTIDPEGSISIIDLSLGINSATVQTADFTAFNNQFAQLKAAGVKFKGDVGTTRTVAQDLEPEYIAFSPDATKAWVTLQEANAIAVVDIATATVESIKPLGFKDYSQTNNALDASDRDNLINIRNWPIFGMYQPDAITSYTANGQTYYITANEGDSRDYDGYSEEARIKDLILDPTAFPNAAELQRDENIGRLLVTTALGDTDGDGDYDQLYSYGGRSFSIWNSEGQLVYDSGDNFERITAELFPDRFNASNSNNNFDNRSDDKGPEPEGVVTGVINGRIYAFIGLERIGGVMVYDVTDPVSPDFVQYVNNRDFTVATDSAAAKDLGPEGLAFISAQDSPNGKPLLVVANEVSGSTTFYQIDLNEAPINNPPTAVVLSNKVTELAENTNTAGGIKVAGISITDDGQGTNVLSLSGADATSFEIRNDELFFIGNSPDFETKTKYDVTVNVDDISVGETPDASTDFTLNITNLPDKNISDRVSQFNNKGNNLGTLVYDLSDVSGNAKTQGDDAALEQTDALFHNLVGLYQVENADGAILDTLDLNGNGAINDLLNPGDTGYARTAITNAVNNFVLQMGANGDPTDNTSSSEFGDVLLQGGKRYAPFAIANGGNLIPVGGTLQDGINNFLAQNPNNTAANLSNFMTHAVAYFSFGSANPDGAEHLQNRGNNVFGFEDLPGNLGISDFDFNDAVFKFTFIA
ncbi:MAG: phytase, partial [Snowella sp.]|nr:phytase [Snowella sp.]